MYIHVHVCSYRPVFLAATDDIHVHVHVCTISSQTTPGDYLEQGRVLAATLCSLWGLRLAATRYALEALHGIVEVIYTYMYV